MENHNKYMSLESLLKADDERKGKEERVENRDTETLRTTTNLPQVCQECLKEFKSRQALWGHSRIHKVIKKEGEEDRYCDNKNSGDPNRRGQKRKRDASTAIASSSRSCLKEEEIVEDKFTTSKEPCETLVSSKNGKMSIFEAGDGSSKIGVSIKEEISTKPKKLYVCIDCDKTFYTHYAFGGHRSYHSKINKKNRAQEADPTNRRAPLFDLNELPEDTDV